MTDLTKRPGAIPLPDENDVLFEQLLEEAGAEQGIATPSIVPRAAGTRVPLTFAQELIWLLDQAAPGLTAYNVAVARRISGSLDVGALERALTSVRSRHEVLRTRFEVSNGEPSQVVDPAAPFTLRIVDLSALDDAVRVAAAKQELEARARTPFDMAREPMFRGTLVRLAENDHILLIETHHAVCDGWSVGVLFGELAAAYKAERRGVAADLPAMRLQYGDVALWERSQLSGARLEELLEFWKSHLAGAEEPLELPTDFAATPNVSFAGARRSRLLTSERLAEVDALARQHGATRYMVLLAAFGTVLHRYSDAAQVLIGSASAGRTQHETESLIGYFSNTVVQRTDFSGDPTFAELLGRTRESVLAVFDHQELPLEKLMLELRRDAQRGGDAPLYRVVFTMQDTGAAPIDFDGAHVSPFGVDLGATKFDLTLLPSERPDGLLLTARYRSDLFTVATIDRFLGHLCQVLDAAVAGPTTRVSALQMLTPEERAKLTAWNSGAKVLTSEPVHVRFASAAARTPSATALASGATRVTYGELQARVNRIARHLASRAVQPGHVVGLHLDRSPDAIAALLGILTAGAAYVPLGSAIPAERSARQLRDSGARVVITDEAHVGTLPDGFDAILLDTHADAIAAWPATAPDGVVSRPDDLAYVLFTSGSTGEPKGVAVTHGNLANYTTGICACLGIGDDGPLVFGTAAALTADLGNTAIFPALASGGALNVLPEDAATNPERLSEYLAAAPLDVLKITPTHLQALIADRPADSARAVLPRKWLVLGGEALTWDLATRLLGAQRCRVLNHYGPTETTVGAATFEVTEARAEELRALGARTVPIGRPLPNVSLTVIDAHGAEVPVGVAGELAIGGSGVARGYVGRADLTAERFIHLADRGRAYRTGDRVRRLPTGDVEYLGRLDGQVKVRGFRVELGEIEAVLAAHPAVAHAAAFLAEGGDAVAAAVVLRDAGSTIDPAAMRDFAALRLPVYMIPATVGVVHALPRTSSGKLDRAALAASFTDAGRESAGATHTAPRTEMERALLQIWADVLKRDAADIGVTDNFLALGGHSLAGIRILGKLSRQFGVRLPLRTLFEAPTIESLAELVTIERELAELDTQKERQPS